MTPPVYLQRGLHGTQPLHTILQFRVTECPEIIRILIVNPRRQHKIQENVIRDFLTPRQFAPCPDCRRGIGNQVFGLINGQVAKRHVGQQEGYSLTQRPVTDCISHAKQVAA